MSVGRNEPCPCGSGRKFKSCCLPLHQKRARWDPLEDRLRERIEDFLYSEEFREDFRNAMLVYGAKPEDREDASKWRMFMDWYVHDYVTLAEDETILKAFLRQKSAQLDDLERDTVRSWSESPLSFYEVTSITRSTGFDVKDIFTGREFFVFDVSGSHSLSRYDLMFARPYRVDEIVRLSGGGLEIPHAKLNDIRKFVEQSLKSHGLDAGSIAEYFRRYSLDVLKFIETLFHPPLLVTPEGDLIVLSKAQYRVTNSTKASSILKSSKEFAYLDTEENALRFDWVPDVGDDPPPAAVLKLPGTLAITTDLQIAPDDGESEWFRVWGNLSLYQDRLVIECVSDQRLHRCKKVVEGLLTGVVEHLGDEYKEINHDTDESEPEDERRGGEDELSYDELSPPLQRGIKRYFEDYYEKWLNTNIPWLGNITPLQASKTPDGRARLDDLLKDMENMREHDDQNDLPAYPVEKLRKKLGLDRKR